MIQDLCSKNTKNCKNPTIRKLTTTKIILKSKQLPQFKNIQMGKHVKGCSTSFAVKEFKFKQQKDIIVRIATIPSTNNTNCWQELE